VKGVLSGKGGVKGQMDAPHTDANQGAKLEELGARGTDLSVG